MTPGTALRATPTRRKAAPAAPQPPTDGPARPPTDGPARPPTDSAPRPAAPRHAELLPGTVTEPEGWDAAPAQAASAPGSALGARPEDRRLASWWTPWPEDVARRYRAAGCWRGETLGDMLRQRAERHPRRTALVDGARRWSYRELDQRADRLADGLRGGGIASGDRVVVQLPTIAAFFEVVFALFRIGALPVLALPAHREAEIAHLCARSRATALIVTDVHDGHDHRPMAQRVAARRGRPDRPGAAHVAPPAPLRVFVAGEPGPHTALSDLLQPVDGAEEMSPSAAPSPGDVALLQPSRSAVRPAELAPRTHDDYLCSLRAANTHHGIDGDTVFLCALPPGHSFPPAASGAFGTLYAGGRVVLATRADPDTAFPLIARERVTHTGLLPPLAHAWTDAAPHTAHDLSSLRTLLVGGGAFGVRAARRITPALGCALQQVFGTAEGLVTCTRREDPLATVVATQGSPISPHDEIRIVGEDGRDVPDGTSGELLARGPSTVRGYWDAPEENARAFTADGFHRTGEVARRTESGHLVIEGRARDRINRGGETFSSGEVERHLLTHPDVREAQLLPVSDPSLGERTCAFLVLRSGARTPEAAAVRCFIRECGLAEFKVPDQVQIVTALPRIGAGRVGAWEVATVPEV